MQDTTAVIRSALVRRRPGGARAGPRASSGVLGLRGLLDCLCGRAGQLPTPPSRCAGRSTAMQWTFGTLPCTANSLNQIKGANAVAVFQDRLWYGINLTFPKPASASSAPRPSGSGRRGATRRRRGPRARQRTPAASRYLFQFIVETETTVVLAGRRRSRTPSLACARRPAHRQGGGTTEVRRSAFDYTAVGHTFDYRDHAPLDSQAGDSIQCISPRPPSTITSPATASSHARPRGGPGGSIYFNVAAGRASPSTASVIITRAALGEPTRWTSRCRRRAGRLRG
jgi:hypothetical protein